MANITAEDFKVVLRDIYDSEEMKIDSTYTRTRTIRSTIEELCSTSQRDKQFEQQYLTVLEATERIIKKAKTDKKEEPFFRESVVIVTEQPELNL